MFLGDLINLEGCESSIDIMDGYVLRKAIGSEIDYIKYQLNSLGNLKIFITRNESHWRQTNYGKTTISPLKRENWRYWIIERKISEDDRYLFRDAIQLCTKDLNSLFYSLYKENGEPHGIVYSRGIFYNFLDDVWAGNYIKSFSKKDAEEITHLYKLLENFKKEEINHMFIKKALEDFRMLKTVSKRTPFFFVSMFSIIESLITHNPSNNSKSINHQLITKLSLLNKRFENPMILSDFFKSPASFENTIKLLYGYRSAIAHGSIVDFEKLQAIESKEKASDFLYSLLKNVIIQSLKEPILITDLKNV